MNSDFDITAKVKGLRELIALCDGIPEKAINKATRKSTREAAKFLKRKVQEKIPVATEEELSKKSIQQGHRPGELKKSPKVRTGKRSRNRISHQVEIESEYILPVEYGTANMAAQAPGRKATDENAEHIIDMVFEEVGREVIKQWHTNL